MVKEIKLKLYATEISSAEGMSCNWKYLFMKIYTRKKHTKNHLFPRWVDRGQQLGHRGHRF